MSTLGTDPPSGPGRIVVGVDGSAHSREALRWALGQSGLTRQSVEAVISWRMPASWGEGAAVLAAIDWGDDARRMLQNVVADVAGPAGADAVTQRVVQGHPTQVLLEAAADAALLVVGSRGRGGFTGVLLGSVSQHVVARAPCPVVVVRADG